MKTPVDNLFPSDTSFFHILPSTEYHGPQVVQMPAIGIDDAYAIQIQTLVAIFIGFAWVVYTIVVGPIQKRSQSRRA